MGQGPRAKSLFLCPASLRCESQNGMVCCPCGQHLLWPPLLRQEAPAPPRAIGLSLSHHRLSKAQSQPGPADPTSPKPPLCPHLWQGSAVPCLCTSAVYITRLPSRLFHRRWTRDEWVLVSPLLWDKREGFSSTALRNSGFY